MVQKNSHGEISEISRESPKVAKFAKVYLVKVSPNEVCSENNKLLRCNLKIISPNRRFTCYCSDLAGVQVQVHSLITSLR